MPERGFNHGGTESPIPVYRPELTAPPDPETTGDSPRPSSPGTPATKEVPDDVRREDLPVGLVPQSSPPPIPRLFGQAEMLVVEGKACRKVESAVAGGVQPGEMAVPWFGTRCFAWLRGVENMDGKCGGRDFGPCGQWPASFASVTGMQLPLLRNLKIVAIAALTSACCVSEQSYNVALKSPDGDGEMRIWVSPDPSLSMSGMWVFFYDTVLWPVDAVASMITIMDRDDAVRVRGAARSLGAVLLPLVTAYARRSSLQGAVLGAHDWPSYNGPICLSLPSNPTLEQVREAMAAAFAHGSGETDLRDVRKRIDDRVVEIELLTKWCAASSLSTLPN